MTKKIMGMALLCIVLTTQINAQYAATVNKNYRQTMFTGNFLGFANQTYYGLTLQKEGKFIKGLLTTSQEESYTVVAKVNDMNILQASVGNNLVTYDCKLYYSSNRLILELDKDLTDAITLLLILTGEFEAAMNVETRIVMKPV